MKRVATLILSMLLAIIVPANASAASFGVGISGPATFESTATLTASLNGYSDISLEYGGIMAMTMDVIYDSGKIDVTISGQNGFTVTRNGSRLVVDRVEGVGSGTAFITMLVTNKTLVSNESTTVTLSNIVGSDSDKNATAGAASKTITFIKNEPAPTPTPTPTPSPTPTPAPSSNATTSTSSSPTPNEAQQSRDVEGGTTTDTNAAGMTAGNINSNNVGKEEKENNETEKKEDSENKEEVSQNDPALIIVAICISAVVAIGATFLALIIRRNKKDKKSKKHKNNK